MTKLTVEDLATFCKKKGFIFRAAEIYGGLSGFFDYGPLGVEFKQKVKDAYMHEFVRKRQDMVAQDGSIITNPMVWKASGHLDSFGDLVAITKQSRTRLRADHFIEDELNIPADGMSAKEINDLIKKHQLKYKGEEIEEIKDFNLLFETKVGADVDSKSVAYLRGETCQSIFPNFRLIAETSRMKLPFGIVQIGKAFRNEISPRDFVFRCREFEQMEMEYFFDPESNCELLTKELLEIEFSFLSSEMQKDGKDAKVVKLKKLLDEKRIIDYHAYWLGMYYNWLTRKLGIRVENLRVREHMDTERSHYSKGTVDIEYNFPHGFKELFGLANRGDYDLRQHQTHSKQKLEFFDEATKRSFLPHVIEPSQGVERLLMAILCEAYVDDKERGNIVLKLPACVAPHEVAVFPLMNKDGIPEKALEIVQELAEEGFNVAYDRSGTVGRRYARADEIGTPFCVTVDYECIEEGEHKGTVTIRDRDTTQQKRVKIEELALELRNLVRGKSTF